MIVAHKRLISCKLTLQYHGFEIHPSVHFTQYLAINVTKIIWGFRRFKQSVRIVRASCDWPCEYLFQKVKITQIHTSYKATLFIFVELRNSY